MPYLFGDSSPSDLQIDYIDFLRDALDFSVQVLAADERMRQGGVRATEVRHAGDAEVARLETLGATLARTIEGSDVGAADSATAQCAHGLLRSAADLVRQAIERVHASVTADVAAIEAEARRDRERCAEALTKFLLRHDLPQMTSELRLQQQAGNGYIARSYARALGDLRAVIELEIPAAHALAHVLRVDKVMERLEVHAPEAGGWLRKEVKLRAQRLEREYITGFVGGGPETTIRLRTAADGTGVGFDLAFAEGAVQVSLRRVGEGEELPPFDLDETDSTKVRDLADKLMAMTADLAAARKSLVEAMLGDTTLVEHRDPKVMVERLVALMAPVVQEIAKRSLTPTELVLKRQLGDGRREEIFVSRRDLQLKLRPLAEDSRALFKPLGLGELPAAEAAELDRAAAEKQAGESKPADKAPADKAPAEKSAVEKSLFGQALAVDKVDVAAKPTVPGPPPAPPGKKDDAVRIDDSLERLLVSEDATPTPQ
jgi:hypothetical protein